MKFAATALKDAEVAEAAITTDGGTVRSGLLLESAMVVGDGAALFNATVQSPLVDGPSVGTQLNDVIWSGATSDKAEDCELPFKAATTDAFWSVVKLPAVALNDAVVAEPATVTEAGTVRTAFVLLNCTAAPPFGAALLNVTVQVLVADGPRLPGAQLRELTRGSETSEMAAFCELPFRLAVTVTFWLALKFPEVALNCAVVAEPGTVTEGGTVRLALLLDSVTAVPPPGAARFNVTVQADVAFVPIVPGAQLRDVTSIGATSDNDTFWDTALKVAVTVAF